METNTSSTPFLNDSGESQVSVGLRPAQLVDLTFLLANAVVSLVGNGLSLAVFTRSRLRRTPYSSYLAAMAVADTGSAILLCVLYSAFIFGYAPMEVFCKALLFSTDLFVTLSSWFVVCFTCERYISVCHPLRARDILARLRARYVTTLITFLAAAANAYRLVPTVTKASDDIYTYTVCFPEHNELMLGVYVVFLFVASILMFIVPAILIVALNVLIVFRLRRNSRNSQLGMQGREAREEQTRVITRTLFLVSLAFFVCNFPVNTLMILSWLDVTVSEWLDCAIGIIFEVGFSCNFFLYAMSGAKFRASVKELFVRQ